MTRRGDTLLFDAPPTVAAWAAAGGKKESEGPLASAFDFVTQDAAFGEQGCENWEQAESLLQRKAVELGGLPGAGARQRGRAGAVGDVWPRAGFCGA